MRLKKRADEGGNIQKVFFDYGDNRMPVELSDSVMVVRNGETYQDSTEVDPYETTRKELQNALGFKPLRELCGPDKK